MSSGNNFLKTLESSLQNAGNQGSRKRSATKEEQPEPKISKVSDEDNSFGFTEINKFEHCASTLQKCIRLIIDSAPSSKELEAILEDKNIDHDVKCEVKSNPRLQMISKLKSLYMDKQLPLFDEITTGHLVENRSLAANGTLNLHKTAETVAKKFQSLSKPKRKNVTDGSARVAGMPELPEIKDPELRARVFQHKSLTAHKSYLSGEELILSHNERVEFLGDAVLQVVSTYIIYDRFPNVPEGRLSDLRTLLVCNRTLGELALNYGMDKILRRNIDASAQSLEDSKIFADVFEAYIGALAIERGYDLQEVQEWLTKLYEPLLLKFSREHNSEVKINKDAKTELYALVGTASLHPTYIITQNGSGWKHPFKVQCILGDDILGEGVAPNFRDAGLRAAMSALENTALIEKYGRKRLEAERAETMKKQDDSSTPTTKGSSLPYVADASIYPSKLARNEAYAYFGKTYGLTPEYRVTYNEKEKKYKAELLVGEHAVTVAHDVSKKNAISRAAMLLLKHRDALHEVISTIV